MPPMPPGASHAPPPAAPPAPPTVLQPMPVPPGFPLIPGLKEDDFLILALTPQAHPAQCLFIHEDGSMIVRVAMPSWLKDIESKLKLSVNPRQSLTQELLQAVAQVLEISLVVRRDKVSDDVRKHVEGIERRIGAEAQAQQVRATKAQADLDVALQAHTLAGDEPATPGQAQRIGDGPGQPEGGPQRIGRIILPGGGGGNPGAA